MSANELPPWHAEIVAQHALFAGWLTGSVPNTDAAFARLAVAIDPTFVIVSPDGTLSTGAALLAGLRTVHGSRPNWQIWIEQPQAQIVHGDLTVATYQEWQRFASGQVTARQSTAVFVARSSAPNGVAWLHVHETWIQL